MNSVFINHTNHSFDKWSAEEKYAAEKIGSVHDYMFPDIDPAWDEIHIKQLARKNGEKIIALKPAAVLCQGEFTYCFALVTYLKEKGIPVLAACSKRESKEWRDDNGALVKNSVFKFVKFRSY